MVKKFIAFAGILLFLSALVMGNALRKGEKLASALDDEKKVFAIMEGPPPCTWEAKVPERVMAENKSQAIVVEVTNSADVDCESTLSLRAPGFDMSPPKEEQKITLKSASKGSLSWILTPRKTGTFELAVSDIINTQIFGITVNNVFGLSTSQAKLFSIVGSLFGPMFTVPWWWDKLRGRKQKQEIRKDVNETKDTPPAV